MIGLFRLFYGLYVVIAFFLLLSACSRMIFKKGKAADKINQFVDDLFFIVFFPVMLLSKEGCSRFIKQIGEYH